MGVSLSSLSRRRPQRLGAKTVSRSGSCYWASTIGRLPFRRTDDFHHPAADRRHNKPAPALIQRIYFSNNLNSHRRESLEQNRIKAQELLDERIHPRGSFTPSRAPDAKHVLDSFKTEKSTDSESVNLSIALLERLVVENIVSENSLQSSLLFDPRYFNPLITLWREAAKKGQRVASPQDLLQKLQAMARTLPKFSYNIATVGMIMEVAVKQGPPEKAPFIAEDLLEFVSKQAEDAEDVTLRPDVFIYNNVMQAWAISRLPQASDKLNGLLETMRNEGIVPSSVTYNILLRYWANQGAVDKIETILDAMKAQRLEPTIANLTQAIYGFATSGNIEKAEEMLKQTIELRPRNSTEAAMIGENTQTILLAYRRIVDDSNSSPLQRDRAVERSETFFKRMNRSCLLTYENRIKMIGTLMSIYASAGKHDQVETIAQHQQLNPALLTILIKSLGQAGKADTATVIMKRVLSYPHSEVRIESFGALMNAWSESSRPDAAAQAFAVLRLLNEDPKCKRLGLKPNSVILGALLKILSKSNSKDASTRAIGIFEEMGRRYQAGDSSVKPDSISYALAIKSCLHVGDAQKANSLLDKMENSEKTPSIRTYNDILHSWSNVGTREAAERTEKILEHLKQLSTTKYPVLKPDVYTYSLVINAWVASGYEAADERIWWIYEMMRNDNVEPSFVVYTTLISFLAKSKERHVVQRADTLLALMEKSKRPDLQPDNRHYVPVIMGWLNIDDAENATRALFRFSTASRTKPYPIIIDMVMQGWIKVGKLVSATSLLTKMYKFKDKNLLPHGPNSNTHKSLIKAWERSNHPDKASSVRELKERFAALQGAKNVA